MDSQRYEYYYNENNYYNVKKNETVEAPSQAIEAAPKKKVARSRKKVEAPAKKKSSEEEIKEEAVAADVQDTAASDTPAAETKESADNKDTNTEQKPQPRVKRDAPASPTSSYTGSNIHDFCDLVNNAARIPMLGDQQIQQLTYEEAINRSQTLERILRAVLDYDIVLSDTNIWLELQVGKTSSHSDPRVNARLNFERQLEAISKMMKRIRGKFMVMSETYEEIDRFASVLEPVNYKDADWSDEVLCRNVAARLAKRLMLAQQKENRLRIEGIGSECHHGAFADPAIIRRTVELFAEGKKVLLLTNDASVGIRSLGMCDDLQRVNKIDDKTWRDIYEPQRPMVLTMDDLKVLDNYTRQYHYLLMAAGRQWMQDVEDREPVTLEKPLQLWMEGFRPGDRHERRSDKLEQQRKEQQRKEQQRLEQERREAEKKAEQERRQEQQRQEQERRQEQQRLEQERREQQRKADRERAAQRKKAEEEKAMMQEATAEEATPVPTTPEPEATNNEPAPQEASAELPTAEVTETEANADAEATVSESKPRSTRRGGRGRRGGRSKSTQQ